ILWQGAVAGAAGEQGDVIGDGPQPTGAVRPRHGPGQGGGGTLETMPLRNRRAAALPAKLSRSWLLVNAARPEDFAPGLASEADSVLFDLEAAVPADQKDAARQSVVEALNGGMDAWVRINGIDTEDWQKDLEALSGATGLRGVMLA